MADGLIKDIFESPCQNWETEIANFLESFSCYFKDHPYPNSYANVALSRSIDLLKNETCSPEKAKHWYLEWKKQTQHIPELARSLRFVETAVAIRGGEQPRRAKLTRLDQVERGLFDEVWEES